MNFAASIISPLPALMNLSMSGGRVEHVTGEDPMQNLSWMMMDEGWSEKLCFHGTTEQEALATEFLAFLQEIAPEEIYIHPGVQLLPTTIQPSSSATSQPSSSTTIQQLPPGTATVVGPSWLRPLRLWLQHIARRRIPWVPQLLFVGPSGAGKALCSAGGLKQRLVIANLRNLHLCIGLSKAALQSARELSSILMHPGCCQGCILQAGDRGWQLGQQVRLPGGIP